MSKRNPTCGCNDECNLAGLDCHPCCRCVPLRLCATLDAEYCNCDGKSAFMELDEHDEYLGAISCAGETMDLRVFLHHEDGRCFWRVISNEFYIDELFEIGVEGGQKCEDPHLQIDAPFYECPGTVTIEKHSLAGVPLVPDDNGCQTPYCGECRCACQTLCVIVDEDGYITEEEWEWDGGGWGRARLVKDTYTGGCLIEIDGYDPVEVGDCDQDVLLLVTNDYTGNSISGYCKHCACDGESVFIGSCTCDPMKKTLFYTISDCGGSGTLTLRPGIVPTWWSEPFTLFNDIRVVLLLECVRNRSQIRLS